MTLFNFNTKKSFKKIDRTCPQFFQLNYIAAFAAIYKKKLNIYVFIDSNKKLMLTKDDTDSQYLQAHQGH